ncbi:MAG TPA: ATP-binding protein [Anaerolineales bacterium]|nr:ATP-binding protein [Anaerolineales bacterium]
MKKFFDRHSSVATADPDDARRRKILNILLLGVGTISILTPLLFLAGIRSLNPRENTLLIGGSIAALAGTTILYYINQKFSGRIASLFFLVLLTTVFAFSDTPAQIATGRSLFVFTIPIIMASILLTPWASFVFSILGSAIISAFAFSIDRLPNLPAILGYFLIAFVSWLSASSLEQALKEVRDINANLDRAVVERTQALAEALERERIEAGRTRAILNSIADGVIVFDRQWNASLANPAIRSILDLPLELIVGKNFRELIEHPKLSPASRNLLNAMIEHDTQPFGFRIEWGGKTLSVSAAQVYNNRNENIGTVTVFRDFTHEAEAEKLKSSFIAIVSHELRTPLNAILGYAEMFREAVYGPLNEKQTKMVERIIKNTQRLLALINDLLDQAQMEAGKLVIQMQPFKPAELLENLHNLMDKAASDKALKLTSEIDDSLPETLHGDIMRLQQILVNLVSNAIKFTDEGEVHVRLFHLNDYTWGIEVTDTGRGIPESEIPHIFETFRQVEGTATRTHGGIGLGLSIVKQLVNLMNGQIRVSSKLGKGTTFTVTLPLIIS